MSAEITAPVFSLKAMKRAFYIFIAVNIIIAVTAVIMFFRFDPIINTSINEINPWYLVTMFIVLGLVSTLSSRKMVKYIRETADPAARFTKYQDFYKRKTIANVSGILITATLCVLTAKYLYLLMLLVQLIIPITLYPRKKMLSALFGNDEATFA